MTARKKGLPEEPSKELGIVKEAKRVASLESRPLADIAAAANVAGIDRIAKGAGGADGLLLTGRAAAGVSGIERTARLLAESQIGGIADAARRLGGLGPTEISAALGALPYESRLVGGLMGTAFDPATLEALRKNAERYQGIIDQAGATATRAYERSSLPVSRSPVLVDPGPSAEVVAISGLNSEVASVAATVGDMATTVGTMAAVAEDAQAGLIRLEALAANALAETVLLRTALEQGQRAANRVGVVIGVFTVVIAVLTGVLVWRAFNGG